MQTLTRAKTLDVHISFHPMDRHDPECFSNGEHEMVAFTIKEHTATAPFCLLYKMEDAAEDAMLAALGDFRPDEESLRDAAYGLAAAADQGRTGFHSVSILEED